jgi:hypothetical protein
METITEPLASGGAVAEPVPARIAAELDRIQAMLLDDVTDATRWGQLYAAQQALLWGMNEDLAAAPYIVITNGKVQPPTGTRAG